MFKTFYVFIVQCKYLHNVECWKPFEHSIETHFYYNRFLGKTLGERNKKQNKYCLRTIMNNKYQYVISTYDW